MDCILNIKGKEGNTRFTFVSPDQPCARFSETTESSGEVVRTLTKIGSEKTAASTGICLNSYAKVDISGYSKLHFKADFTSKRTNYRPEFGVNTSKVTSQSSGGTARGYGYKFTEDECASAGVIEHDLDLSGADKTVTQYVFYAGVANMMITEFWLE